MPLKDVKASPAELEQLALSQARRKREMEEARLREADRTSPLRTYRTDEGTLWSYVVIDGAYARIASCATTCTTLRIPESIEGVPVRELGMDSCSYLEGVEQISCPDCISWIGLSAFRFNAQLRRLVLPHDTDSFDATWVRGCEALEELVFPGLAPRVDASVFDAGELRVLRLGKGARTVVPGAFAKSRLASIEVDAANPYLATDGYGLVAEDGALFVALAVPLESYRVPDTCTAIGKKAFAGRGELARVELPDGIGEIAPYAFSRTGLAEFAAPPALKEIGERAFFRSELAHVELNEGLVYIGSNAFDATKLTRLEAPASIERLGVHIADDEVVRFSDGKAGFSIAAGAKVLHVDGHGGLYRSTENGSYFVRMLDPSVRDYAVAPGTRVVEDGAFARHRALRSVSLPDGLEIVGEAAFKDCRELSELSVPESLRVIGEEAFADTALEQVRLPAGFERLGSMALATYGARHDETAPSLRDIEVADGNKRFSVDQGMLLERRDDGSVQVVLFTDTQPVVHIPDDVSTICPYAFNNARHLRELHLSTGIASVGTRGLGIDSPLELLHIDLVEPVDGHASFDLRFPYSERSKHEIALAFNTSSWIDVARIISHYDNSVINMHDYDVRNSGDFDLYGQAKRLLARLLDPVLMTRVNRSMYDRIVLSDLVDICVAVARHDDRDAIDALVDLGYLNAGNLMEVIDAVGTLQDAAMTGYLLEIKRRLFSRESRAVDFEL